MGQGTSSETDAKLKALVSKLSKLEIKDIEAVFMELSTTTDEGQFVIQQPSWLNRDKFAEIFGLNDLIVEQLFQAFDRDKNGIIDLQEFVTGMALCLHGGIKEKCHLLFKIFNLNGDEGISREELSTVLTSCLMSANTLLQSTLKTEGLSAFESQLADQTGAAVMLNVVVDKIVKEAFDTCDVSNTGKLEIDEFAKWVHKNPKLMNNIFVLQCPKPTPSPIKSSESSFSVLTMAGQDENIPEANSKAKIEMASSVSQITEESTKSLLELSQETNTPTTAGDLFKETSQPSADGADFFDTLGSHNETPSQAPSGQLPRPASELFLSSGNENSNIDGLQHSTSHNDLASLKQQPAISHLQNTESMQSIALSRDSLAPDSHNASQELGTSTENITSLVPQQHTEPTIQPHQENQQQTLAPVDPSSYQQQQSSTQTQQQPPIQPPQTTMQTQYQQQQRSDHSQSFDNPALALETGVNNEVFPEQPAVIQNTILNNSQVYNDKLVDPAQEQRRRGCSFWRPSTNTERLLQQYKQGAIPEMNVLTSPSVLVENLMGDPVKDLVRKYLGEQEANKRPTLMANQVEMNENGLRRLLAAGCWRAAVDFTTKYLTAHGQGLVSMGQNQRSNLSPSILQIWFVRIALLVKLRMFSSAEAELNAFKEFDAPDLYYQYYPELYQGKKGSIVPFSLRLIHAELPQHNGRPNVALDRLYALLEKVDQVIGHLEQGLSEDGTQWPETQDETEMKGLADLWKLRRLRLHYAIGNCFSTMKEYTLAIGLYEECAKLQPENEIATLSGIGRIYLQLGDLRSAQKYFTKVEVLTKDSTDVKLNNMVTMNSGYHALANGKYNDSYQFFTTAMKNDADNFTACNNAAVCLLFLGMVKEASNLLENMVWRSPNRSLHEDILFNLNTVYELETSRALQKKHKILDLVCQHKGDGFNTQCLKLS